MFRHKFGVLAKKLKSIKLLLMDVDGVMTNGKIVYDDQGYEIKQFNVKDGLGIRLLLESGIHVGVITGRRSPAVVRRCTDLGIKYFRTSAVNKADALEGLSNEINVLPENIAFIGDDLPDLPAMTRVGLPVAVADANKLVLKLAKLVTSTRGGEGAIREFAELVLKSKGKWKQIIEQFIK